ncbi:ABC transporter substrate-binding protein [Streptomyces sp. NPDC057623]|uniref:ABC transporter substrate-binding protein n=1 Tax=Streptomyces sp. NPDC057623 TaxID=3346187 RepID=UPI00369DA351
MNNAKIGAALLGGYMLGRTKKVKLALGLGALLAGSRIKPGQVGKALQESPFVHTLTDQVRSELTDAGKAAATTVLSSKADHLADTLHQRTAGLRERAQEEDTEAEDDVEDETEQDETETETEQDEEPRDEGNGEERRAKPRKEASRSAGRGRSQRGRPGRDDEEEPRRRKTSASQSRSRGGGAARSSRQGQDHG